MSRFDFIFNCLGCFALGIGVTIFYMAWVVGLPNYDPNCQATLSEYQAEETRYPFGPEFIRIPKSREIRELATLTTKNVNLGKHYDN